MAVRAFRSGAFDRDVARGQHAWLAPLVLFVITILVRLPGLADAPINDELYTVLAARGWLLEGEPRIADGAYPRAELYTVLTAQFLAALGDSLVVARWPALLAAALLVVLVFVWTRAQAGRGAAWIAALLLSLAPVDLQVATFARFYAVHGVLFWLAATGVFALTEQPMSRLRQACLALGVGLCLLLAHHLQPLTLIGAGGLALWLAGTALPWLGAQRQDSRRFRMILGAGALLAVAAVVLLVESGAGQALLERYRMTPVHAQSVANKVWYYQLQLIERYPTLWAVTPFLALIAVASRPRVALFCLVVFFPALAVLSLAAMKHTHYIYFLQPFLFVLWAVALARAWRLLRRCVIVSTDQALRRVAPALAGRAARAVVIAGCILFLVLANGAPARTLLKPLGVSLGENERATDWIAAAAVLEPWLRSGPVIVTANDMHTLYYLGDYDFALNASRVSEIPSAEEFALDPRTGRPAVGKPASLERIIACYPSGLILSDVYSWRADRAIDDAAANLIIARTEPIELPARLRLLAFHWQHPEGAAQPAGCAALPAPQAAATAAGRQPDS